MDLRDVLSQLRAAGRIHEPSAFPDDPYIRGVLGNFLDEVSGDDAEQQILDLRNSTADYLNGSRSGYTEIASGLYRELAEGLDDAELRSRLSDVTKSAIAVEDTGHVNATSFAVGDAWVTLLDRKMIEVLYVSARATAGRVNRPRDVPSCESCEDHRCDSPSSAHTARRWFESGWRSQRGYRQIIEFWMPTRDQLFYANMLATQAETFVLAHEIGHHVAGHTSGLRSEARTTPRRFMTSWDIELEADEVAASLLIGRAVRSSAVGNDGALDGAPLLAMALGIAHFFVTAELLARVSDPPSSTAESDTHPPIVHRRDAIAHMFSSEPGLQPLTKFGSDHVELHRGFWSVLAQPSNHDVSYFERTYFAARSTAEEAFEAVGRLGHDHMAQVAPSLNQTRGETSQVLFDSAVNSLGRLPGVAGAAARFYFRVFCDTPPTLVDAVDPTMPFMGLGGFVASDRPFEVGTV